jgi:hypothetical protein
LDEAEAWLQRAEPTIRPEAEVAAAPTPVLARHLVREARREPGSGCSIAVIILSFDACGNHIVVENVFGRDVFLWNSVSFLRRASFKRLHD